MWTLEFKPVPFFIFSYRGVVRIFVSFSEFSDNAQKCYGSVILRLCHARIYVRRLCLVVEAFCLFLLDACIVIFGH